MRQVGHLPEVKTLLYNKNSCAAGIFFIARKSLFCSSELSFTKQVWRGACYYIYDIFNNNHSFMCEGAKYWAVTLNSIKFPSNV